MARIVGFNYAILSDVDGDWAREQARAVHSILERTSRYVVEIGNRLLEVRKRLGKSRFNGWIKAEFRWSQPVASNYMRVANKLGSIDCLDAIQPSALYAMAREKVPPQAVESVVAEARSGRIVTKTRALEIISHHASEAVGRSPIGREHLHYLRAAITIAEKNATAIASALNAEEREDLVNRLLAIGERLRGSSVLSVAV